MYTTIMILSIRILLLHDRTFLNDIYEMLRFLLGHILNSPFIKYIKINNVQNWHKSEKFDLTQYRCGMSYFQITFCIWLNFFLRICLLNEDDIWKVFAGNGNSFSVQAQTMRVASFYKLKDLVISKEISHPLPISRDLTISNRFSRWTIFFPIIIQLIKLIHTKKSHVVS